MSLITFENVSFYYKKSKPVLQNLSFSINAGEHVRLTGASGVGKTTVLRLITGLEKAKKGVITINQDTYFSASFQENRLLNSRTALENVELFSNTEIAEKMLDSMNLSQAKNMYPSELSGGMKRRLSLSRALARLKLHADVLILDEPFTGLDSDNIALCIEAVKAIEGKTLILVTHNDNEAKKLADREIILM